MAAPLPKVAVLREDGQIVGVEDEAEDEAVLAERRMIEGSVRVYIPLGACILSSPSQKSLRQAECLLCDTASEIRGLGVTTR